MQSPRKQLYRTNQTVSISSLKFLYIKTKKWVTPLFLSKNYLFCLITTIKTHSKYYINLSLSRKPVELYKNSNKKITIVKLFLSCRYLLVKNWNNIPYFTRKISLIFLIYFVNIKTQGNKKNYDNHY